MTCARPGTRTPPTAAPHVPWPHQSISHDVFLPSVFSHITWHKRHLHVCVQWRRDRTGHFSSAVCWTIIVSFDTSGGFSFLEWSHRSVYSDANSGSSAAISAEYCGVSFCSVENYCDNDTMRYGANIVIFDTIRYIVPTLWATRLNK